MGTKGGQDAGTIGCGGGRRQKTCGGPPVSYLGYADFHFLSLGAGADQAFIIFLSISLLKTLRDSTRSDWYKKIIIFHV